MFKNLANRLSHTFSNIRGRGRLTEDNIKSTLRDVRMALLEADTALPVVQEFINRVKKRALGQDINKSLTPGQAFVKLVHTELVKIIGDENNALNLSVPPPAVVLMAGLQGSGKTTSVGKLGNFLREKQKKKVLVVSADVYRPAAIKQLEMLAATVGVDFWSSDVRKQPLDIVIQAFNNARMKFYDVLVVDTAGCMHLDEKMTEIKAIHSTIQPVESLLVMDAMTGQDATNIAKSFNKALPLTGFILTKLDGDTRGGAALSISYITGKPIKFIGLGEKTDALEQFCPDRLARRILGMSDVLSLIEEIESNCHMAKADNFASKLKKEDVFNMTYFLEQIKQMRNIGGMASLISKLPGIHQLPQNVKYPMDDKVLLCMEAIINSMTAKERFSPHMINGSRKRRIAAGSGMQVQDVNRLLKQFDDMQRMITKIKKGGMVKMIRSIKGMMPYRINS